MRIITGRAKGTKLKAPKGNQTRPTADRVKESIFNIISNLICGANVLDLFAGTGSLGLEALSRGASKAVFVDQNYECVRLIRENAVSAKMADLIEVYKCECLVAIDKLSQRSQKFDLIFCDPPYNKGLVEKVLRKIVVSGVLTDGGLMVVEHSRHENIEQSHQPLFLERTERYGETMVSFLKLH